MPDVPLASARPLDPLAAARLRRLNLLVGSAHAVQALALLALAADVSLPVTASFLTGPPGAGGYDSASLDSLRAPDGRAAGMGPTSLAGSTRRAGGSTRSAHH